MQNTNWNGVPFKITFNKNVLNLETLVKKSFKNLNLPENLKDKKKFLSNKIEPNIKALCVHGFKLPSIEKNFYKKCNIIVAGNSDHHFFPVFLVLNKKSKAFWDLFFYQMCNWTSFT